MSTNEDMCKTMTTVIREALTKAGVSADFINEDLMIQVVKLMESSYNQGYDDGREDTQIKHKLHVMRVLREELEP